MEQTRYVDSLPFDRHSVLNQAPPVDRQAKASFHDNILAPDAFRCSDSSSCSALCLQAPKRFLYSGTMSQRSALLRRHGPPLCPQGSCRLLRQFRFAYNFLDLSGVFLFGLQVSLHPRSRCMGGQAEVKGLPMESMCTSGTTSSARTGVRPQDVTRTSQ